MPGPWLSWRSLSCKSSDTGVAHHHQHPSRRHRRQKQQKQQQEKQHQQQQQLQQQHSQQQRSSCKRIHNPLFDPKSARSSSSSSERSSLLCRPGRCSSLRDVVHGNTRVAHRSSPLAGKEEVVEEEEEEEEDDEAADCMQQISQEALVARDDIPFIVQQQHEAAASCEQATNAAGSSSSASSSAIAKPAAKQQQSPTSLPAKRRLRSACNGCSVVALYPRMQPQLSCFRCGDCFSRLDALETHHAVHHAVSELPRGDSSRNIVEIIFRSSWASSLACGDVETVLKLHASHRLLSRFNEYRERIRSGHVERAPRCLADGNEHLRFRATSFACNVGSRLCASPRCHLCRIIRCGFPAGSPVLASATSGAAHAAAAAGICGASDGAGAGGRAAMLVCRVVAGRSDRSASANLADISAAPAGYDSVEAPGGDLLVFNPAAVLPCFVILYKT